MISRMRRFATPDHCAIVAIAILLIAFFSPVWASGHVFISDGQYAAFFAPLSTWSDAWIGGWPVGADTTSYVWYPIRVLMLWSHLGFNAFVVSAYVIAALGVYAYLRIVGIAVGGSMVGGVGFALSGFMAAHLGHTSMIHAAAWVPWIFASMEGCISRGQRRWALVGAVAVAMSCLAGHMQITFYGLLVSSIYLAWRLPACWRERKRREWVMAVIAIAIGILIAAPQLLMTIAYVEETLRSEITYQTFTQYSLPRSQLSTMLFPFLFGGFLPRIPPYFGEWNFTELCFCTPFLFIALGAVGCLFRRRDVVAFWVVLAFVAILLSLGGNLPALAHATYQLPGFNMFRVPARHLMEFCLALCILAAFGFDRLAREPSRRVMLGFLAGTTALAIVAVGLSVPALQVADEMARVSKYALPDWSHNPAIWAGLCGIGAGLIAALSLASSRIYARVAFAVFAFVGMFTFAWFAEWRSQSRGEDMVASPFELDIAQRLHTEGGRVLHADNFGSARFTYERTRKFDMPSANWYGPLIPRRAADLLQTNNVGAIWPQALFPENVVLDLYGVRFVATVAGLSERSKAVRAALVLPRWHQIGQDYGTFVYENQRALPLAWLCPTWRQVSAKEAIDTLQEAGEFDPRREALVEKLGSGGVSGDNAETVDAKWENRTAIGIDVESKNGGFLVVSVNNIEGWAARVDGASQPIYTADYALVGLPLSKGRHRVELEYRVPAWRWIGPWSAALVGLALVARSGRRRGPSEDRRDAA